MTLPSFLRDFLWHHYTIKTTVLSYSVRLHFFRFLLFLTSQHCQPLLCQSLIDLMDI